MFLSGKLILSGLEPIDEILKIRKKVFIDEQNLPEFMLQNDEDDEAIFALAFEESETSKIPVGTARLLFLGDEFKLGRLCVLNEYRGKGYADFIVRMLIDKAFQMGAKEVHVDAQLSAIGFYKKIGFTEIGKIKNENGFEEQPMVLIKEDLCRKCHNS